jgi:hypothetical protein
MTTDDLKAITTTVGACGDVINITIEAFIAR